MKDHDVDALIPPPADGLTPYRQAVALALGRVRGRRGRDELAGCRGARACRATRCRATRTGRARPCSSTRGRRPRRRRRTRLWRVIEGIGGENGWYSSPLLWAIRGWMDRLVGGIGLARGRRSRARLEVGDALDFWRVEAIERGSFLRLRAEMKVPGLAWLELRASARGRRLALRPARGVLPAGPRRAAVLARGAAVPRVHLPRHGEPDRRGRGCRGGPAVRRDATGLRSFRR